MVFRTVTRIIVVLAATAALAQGTPPGTTPGAPFLNQRPGLASRRGPVGNKNADLQGPAAMRQRVDDMESTLAQMHLVLKQMQSRAAKSGTKDSLATANLGMWELMVGHLDKELGEMRVALAAREDMEARRAALYKQADAKAAAEAQAARAAQAAKFGVEPPTGAQGGVQGPAGQTTPTQAPASPTPSPAAPASPAPSAPSPN